MYILHRLPKRDHTLRSVCIALLVLVTIGAGVWYGRQFFKSDTKIGTTPKAVVTKVVDKRGAPKHIDLPAFSIDLPHDWEQFERTDNPIFKPTYSWRNTAENKGVRQIDMFLDSTPQAMAVNNIMPVEAAGNHVVPASASDNCANFTPKTAENQRDGKGPSKWQGVDFICDTGNYVRHVVGIGASGGPTNTVKLTGASGAHSIFLTYTDATATPDDGIFSEALQSLKLK